MSVFAHFPVVETGARPPSARYPSGALLGGMEGRFIARLKTGGILYCVYMVVKMGLYGTEGVGEELVGIGVVE